MDAVIHSFLSGLPILLLHFTLTLLMLALGAVIYVMITPYHEVDLIKQGNVAAAISFGGVLVGLALPLAMNMAGSVNAFDILVFGAVAIILQLLAYRLTDIVLKDLPKRIKSGEISAAITLVALKLSISVINAAAVSS
jgi:putative membrane protein